MQEIGPREAATRILIAFLEKHGVQAYAEKDKDEHFAELQKKQAHHLAEMYKILYEAVRGEKT